MYLKSNPELWSFDERFCRWTRKTATVLCERGRHSDDDNKSAVRKWNLTEGHGLFATLAPSDPIPPTSWLILAIVGTRSIEGGVGSQKNILGPMRKEKPCVWTAQQ
jgi:hypothetical protein